MKITAFKKLVREIGSRGALKSTPFFYVQAFYEGGECVTFVIVTRLLPVARRLAKNFSRRLTHGKATAVTFYYYRNRYIYEAVNKVDTGKYVVDNI